MTSQHRRISAAAARRLKVAAVVAVASTCSSPRCRNVSGPKRSDSSSESSLRILLSVFPLAL